MAVEWTLDDVAAGRVPIDEVLGPDPEATTARQLRADQERRFRAQQRAAEEPEPVRVPVGWWLPVWAVGMAVMWLGVGLVNVSTWAAARDGSVDRRVVVGVWYTVGLVLVALVGGAGGAGVLGAVVVGVLVGPRTVGGNRKSRRK